MKERVVEVTAPLCLCLADGAPRAATEAPGVVAVRLAIDRRASCVVRPRERGVVFESRDSGEKVEAAEFPELTASGGTLAPLAGAIIRLLGVDAGLHITTHSPVPVNSGLPVLATLSLAMTGAIASLTSRGLTPAQVASLATQAVEPVVAPRFSLSADGFLTPFVGGAHLVEGSRSSLRWRSLAADPARLEECILLVDAGPTDGAPSPERSSAGTGFPDGVVAALEAGRMEDVTRLIAENWDARASETGDPGLRRIAEIAREAGGAIRPCAPGRGGLVLAWAVPGGRGSGARERLEAALRKEGFRLLPVRVDLRGLVMSE